MSNHAETAPLFRDPTYTAAAVKIEEAHDASESGWYAGELDALAQAREHIDTLTRMSVYKARAAGETWAQIAASLHVTKQAAQQRYGRPTDRD